MADAMHSEQSFHQKRQRRPRRYLGLQRPVAVWRRYRGVSVSGRVRGQAQMQRSPSMAEPTLPTPQSGFEHCTALERTPARRGTQRAPICKPCQEGCRYHVSQGSGSIWEQSSSVTLNVTSQERAGNQP